MFLPKDSVSTIYFGPMLSPTDGKTAITDLTGMTIYVSKNGAASGARNSGTALTHDARGYYRVELDDTDTGTIGELVVSAAPATALPRTQRYMVVDPSFSLLVRAGGTVNANVVGWPADDDEEGDEVVRAKRFAPLLEDANSVLNLRDFFNATGYDAANSTIGTVTNAGSGDGDANLATIDGSAAAVSMLKQILTGAAASLPLLSIGEAETVGGTVDANLTQINGDTGRALALDYLTQTVIAGLVVDGANTATQVKVSGLSATTGLYIGKTLTVATGTRAGEGGKLVTAWNGASGLLTVEAMTGPLAPGDIILLVG